MARNRKTDAGSFRREDRDRRNAEEARAILERVARESETVGASSLARTADRVTRHFSGEDKAAPGEAQDDPIEVLGKRIGRVLSLIAFVALAIYLYVTWFAR
jgi:hypothetical protein